MLILDDGWQTVEMDGAALEAAKELGREQAKAERGGSGSSSSSSSSSDGMAAAAQVDAAAAEAAAKEAAEASAVAAAAAAAAEEEADDTVLSVEEVERQQQMNDPAQHSGTQEDSNPVIAAVSEWYRNHVDGADMDATPVRVWRALATTVFKPALRGFFVGETEFCKRLAAFPANEKFEDPKKGTSLKLLLESLREELGELRVYCWHTLGGYWGGVSTTAPAVAHLEAKQHQQRPTRSLLEVEPALQWDAVALCGVGAITQGHELELFHGIHGYLQDAGVDGVKIDAQSGIGPMGDGFGGGPHMVRGQVHAMEASVSEHFEGNRCINCMAHSSENLFQYRETSIIRAADDFYPSEAPSHPVHIAQVAYNSLFLGEICHVDWDMFQSHHPAAAIHAAARAVGGCQIYVSDRPGSHNVELLRRLVLPDGSTLVCEQPGRPTRDTLFADVNADGVSALKVWNTNQVTGILGAFNVQGARWDRGRRRFAPREGEVPSVVAQLRPDDVEGLCARVANRCDEDAEECDVTGGGTANGAASGLSALYLHQARRVELVPAGAALPLTLADREWEVATVSPLATATSAATHWAPFGLLEMLNGGGAIVASRLVVTFGRPPTAHVRMRATGLFGAYCQPRPRAVRINGQPLEFVYDGASGLLQVPMVRSSDAAELTIEFPRRPLANVGKGGGGGDE